MRPWNGLEGKLEQIFCKSELLGSSLFPCRFVMESLEYAHCYD